MDKCVIKFVQCKQLVDQSQKQQPIQSPVNSRSRLPVYRPRNLPVQQPQPIISQPILDPEELGCFPHSILETTSIQAPLMTVNKCAELCNTQFVGLQEGRNCYCISPSEKNRYVSNISTNSSCKKKCTGDLSISSPSCGDEYYFSLYRVR